MIPQAQSSLLGRFAQEVNLVSAEAELYQLTARSVRALLPFVERCSVALLAAEGERLVLHALDGSVGASPTGAILPVSGTMLGEVVQRRSPVLYDGGAFLTSKLADVRMLHAMGMRATLDVPLLTGGAVIGTLNTATPASGRYQAHDAETLSQVAALLSANMDRFRLIRELQEAAAAAQREAARKGREARMLDAITRATAGEIGEGFLHSLVRHLAGALEVRSVFVAEPMRGADGQVLPRARALAFWDGAEFQYGVEYEPHQDLCGGVLSGRLCHYPDGVLARFAALPLVDALRIESYVGVPLCDNEGRVLGHLAVMDTKPLFEDDALRVIQVFAARAQSELLRMGAERERMQALAELREAKDGAEAASRAKSAFLAKMSHELRTPLNAILGFTQLLCRARDLRPEHQAHLRTIRQSGEHLLSLINDTLEMSKIEAGRLTLRHEDLDLFELLDGIEAMLRLRAEDKGLRLRFARQPDVPRFVRTDGAKLRQVLLNLLGNAIKFTQRGEVTLAVSANGQEPGAARIAFGVKDSGPGIAPSEQGALFDAFYQAEAGRQSHEGAGLGLPISQQFVRLMGGAIAVESEPGRGACFRFDIRVELVEVPAATPRGRAPRRVVGLVLAQGEEAPLVLVAEDRRQNRELLCELLRGAGFRVLGACDGQVALEEWRRASPAFIWMDIAMPVMDGREATRRIRAEASGRGPVIVALTASAFEEDRAAVLAIGCDDFVRKPFEESEIFECMARYLDLRYRYEEGVEDEAPSPPDVSALRDLPEAWLTALREAAVQLDLEHAWQVVGWIRERSPGLARVIADTIERCDFAKLQRLAEP